MVTKIKKAQKNIRFRRLRIIRAKLAKPPILMQRLFLVVVLVVAGIVWSAISASLQRAPVSDASISQLAKQNKKVRLAMRNHKVEALAGDYKRLSSIKNPQFKMAPLENCNAAHLTSKQDIDQLGFEEKSFSYLLTLNGSPSSAAHCSLDEIIKSYGKPNESFLIAGGIEHPSEVLLFYDAGSTLPALMSANSGALTNTVLPIPLSQLPHTSCTGKSTMNIVAHEDDDLLFINPQVLQNIRSGACVRTVYLTAGDAGQNEQYWQSRERASEAAYIAMTGANSIWTHRTIKLGEHQFITVVNPKGNGTISLIFMRLPDGQPKGTGYAVTHYESMERLNRAAVQQLHSVDSLSYYDHSELTGGLTALMRTYKVSEVYSQTPYNASGAYPDHSDHIAAGQIARTATDDYGAATMKFYTGYPIHGMPGNLTEAEIAEKQSIFLQYALHDGAVCQSELACNNSTTYGSYLRREYQSN